MSLFGLFDKHDQRAGLDPKVNPLAAGGQLGLGAFALGDPLSAKVVGKFMNTDQKPSDPKPTPGKDRTAAKAAAQPVTGAGRPASPFGMAVAPTFSIFQNKAPEGTNPFDRSRFYKR